MSHFDSPTHPEPKSKSQIKREMTALQALGEKLVKLSAEQLKQLTLPEKLRNAVDEARRITSHGAKRRQLQYIGRLMREIDAKPIADALEDLLEKTQHSAAQFHALEMWRERLIVEDKAALTEFLHEFPQVDRQHLRHLIKEAQKERKEEKPTGAARSLFRYLHEIQRMHK